MYSWPLGDFGCGIATLLSELVTYVSIVTMIMFSIERYLIKNYFWLENRFCDISTKGAELNYLSNIFLDILWFAIPKSFAFYQENDGQRQSLHWYGSSVCFKQWYGGILQRYVFSIQCYQYSLKHLNVQLFIIAWTNFCRFTIPTSDLIQEVPSSKITTACINRTHISQSKSRQCVW